MISDLAREFVMDFFDVDGDGDLDSSTFYRDDGCDLSTVLIDEVGRGEANGDLVKYDFQDGSSIITSPGAWDFGHRHCACFCWVGAGHVDGCSEAYDD